MTVNGSPFSRTSLPINERSPPNRVRHRPSLITTTAAPLPLASSGTNVRPATGRTPSTSKNRVVTNCRSTLCSVPSVPSSKGPPPIPMLIPPNPSNVRVCSSRSRRVTGDTGTRGNVGARSHTMTRRSGSGYGRGRINVASASANMALLAPMPSASVIAATAVKAGDTFNCRSANLTSSRRSPIHRVTRISRSRFLPRSTHVRLSLFTSPSRASTISRAIRGSSPSSTSSRVRISMWKAISSSTS